jgi:hypothetical protein
LTALQVSRTARAAHAGTLAELATDAASGRPGQRAVITRSTSADRWFAWSPRTTARWWEVTLVGAVSTGGSTGAISVTLSVTDGVTTVSGAPAIPVGLRGDESIPVSALTSRLSSTTVRRWTLDTDLVPTLDPTVPWFLRVQLTTTGAAVVETLTLAEVPRYSYDQGIAPSVFLPRGVVDTTVAGLWAVSESALDRTPHTWHALSVDDALPWGVSGVVDYAALTGDSLPGGAPIPYTVRPRSLRAEGEPVRALVRYRAVGGSGAVRAVLGSGGTVTVPLPDTSGAWSWAWGDGVWGVNPRETVTWLGKRDSGATVQVSARAVVSW